MATHPAQTLRDAAQKLREASAEAAAPPWTTNRWGNVETADLEEVAEVWPLRQKPAANAAFIALMHPGVGTALAKWLETTAAEMDAVDGTEYQAADGGDIASWNAALAVARQIIGQVTE